MPTARGGDKPADTKVRLLESATELFSGQGFGGTGIKAVLAAADAPYGSLYHFFPGGKRELGAAALAYGGERARTTLDSIYAEGSDVVEATTDLFDRVAKLLDDNSFDRACPIATIALEVANRDELMREAAAGAFESWLTVLGAHFIEAGMSDECAREVAIEVFCLMEGAVLLARTIRSTEPLRTAGRAAKALVSAGLAE